MFNFTGVITESKDPKQGESAKGAWAAREFVVTESNPDNPQYPQSGKFNLFKSGDYIDYALDKFPKVGTKVEIEFSINAKPFTSKAGKEGVIQELRVFKMTPVSQVPTSAASQPAPLNDDEDDLPF
jgi:hypothetical protein